MFKKLSSFLASTSGATGIEYGFIFGGMSITVMTGAFMIGEDISSVFESFSAYLNAGMTVGGSE